MTPSGSDQGQSKIHGIQGKMSASKVTLSKLVTKDLNIGKPTLDPTREKNYK